MLTQLFPINSRHFQKVVGYRILGEEFERVLESKEIRLEHSSTADWSTQIAGHQSKGIIIATLERVC